MYNWMILCTFGEVRVFLEDFMSFWRINVCLDCLVCGVRMILNPTERGSFSRCSSPSEVFFSGVEGLAAVRSIG